MLALLLSMCQWHYLAATAAAVEAAVLHNFAWHQRVTWRDRAPASTRDTLRRLWRFHLLNGAVSMAGNLGIVAVLAGAAGLHPLVANAVAVLACSVVNFFGSEVLVFRTTVAAALIWLSPLHAGTAAAGESVASAELRPHTVAAWQKYEKAVDERHRNLTPSSELFFAHDGYRRDPGWRQRVMNGAIEMFQADAPAPDADGIDVPDGKIHHWVGAVFVRGATLEGVLRRLQGSSGREADFYKEVIASRLIERRGNTLRVYLKVQRDATITTVTYNTEHLVEYRTLGRDRATQRSVATKIAELTGAGTPNEHEKPQGNDSGYLWRWNAYWRYAQVPGGVLIECESLSLSRSVPLMLRPLVNPIANRLARESLRGTLATLRTTLAPAQHRTAGP